MLKELAFSFKSPFNSIYIKSSFNLNKYIIVAVLIVIVVKY
jgi:hypothetical protein